MRWLVLFGVWVIYFTFGLVVTSLAPLVKLIEHDLGMSHAQMGTVMGAWQLVYIAAALPCGILLDRLGSRWALLLGALCVAASSYGRGQADSFYGLLLAVMLFGIGGPIISAGAPKVIARWFQGQSRGFAMGVYVTGPAVGGVVSLTFTHGWLLPLFEQDWRRILMLWAALAALSGVLWWGLASLPGIRCPVMAIQGEGDAYGTMMQLDAIARQVSGPCELVKLADCGHTPHKEQPEKTLAAVTRFIESILKKDTA